MALTVAPITQTRGFAHETDAQDSLWDSANRESLKFQQELQHLDTAPLKLRGFNNQDPRKFEPADPRAPMNPFEFSHHRNQNPNLQFQLHN